jgi:benzoyl-CoA-dihydrodiol lyase
VAAADHAPVDSFATHPSQYRHYTLDVQGSIATLTLDIDEDNGLRNGYLLKQNSYDLGVDIELHDAVERLRFEYPQVRTVVVTSGQPKVFCAGANIRMLASSTHHFKVNFCKYTNETRCGIEEASAQSGQTWLAALNGTAAGGGYELALACDEICLIDDRSSAVSLPEVPLLGVLPGTGGLTRLVDKRKVRRDVADVFCTKAEGFRARDAVKMGLVDHSFKRSRWASQTATLAETIAGRHPARAEQGITLTPLDVDIDEDGRGRRYRYVSYRVDVEARTAELTMRGPTEAPAATQEAFLAQGASAWALQAFRELDDALIHLRFNHPTAGLLLLHTSGDADLVMAHDALVAAGEGTWFADEVRWFQGRTLRRLDNMAKSMFAIIGPDSCFVGSMLELAFSADRSYMLDDPDSNIFIRVTSAQAGRFAMATGLSRLQCRFQGELTAVDEALATEGRPIDAADAFELGLVTLAPDDIDWEDEVRIAIEERVSLSPDALTGMEQNLRFVGRENFETKIYGRLSAWQNWIFQRPNAVGEQGALTLYGHPESPRFDWGRT